MNQFMEQACSITNDIIQTTVSALLFTTPTHNIPSFAGLITRAGHALAGCEVDGAGAVGVSALPVYEMASTPYPLTVLHSLSECGRGGTDIYISQTTPTASMRRVLL